MAKLNKTFIIIGAGIATTLIGYYVYDLLRTKSAIKKLDTVGSQKTVSNNTIAVGETTSNQAQESNDGYPLKIGSYGAKVYVLQDALNKLGSKLTLDGKFGQSTYKAVNSITFGFGLGNVLCGLDYGCTLTFDNWNSIIKKAEEKGFNTNASWTSAKKLWKV